VHIFISNYDFSEPIKIVYAADQTQSWFILKHVLADIKRHRNLHQNPTSNFSIMVRDCSAHQKKEYLLHACIIVPFLNVCKEFASACILFLVFLSSSRSFMCAWWNYWHAEGCTADVWIRTKIQLFAGATDALRWQHLDGASTFSSRGGGISHVRFSRMHPSSANKGAWEMGQSESSLGSQGTWLFYYAQCFIAARGNVNHLNIRKRVKNKF
jgi:hypothetical protein